MSILHNRRLLRAIVISSILIPLVSFSQVTIKERVEIKPSGKTRVQAVSDDVVYFEGSISPNNSHQSLAVLRSCQVTATGAFTGPGTSIQIIMGTYDDLTNNSVTKKIYCGGAIGFELWTWTTCAIVVESIQGSISGNSATYVISGYQSFPHPMNVPFTATVIFSASPLAEFDLANFTLGLNSGTEIVCGGSLPITFTALDGGGRVFCDPSNTQVTASVSASGDYVYLMSQHQSGRSITFPLSEGSFSLVLDPALGLIPNGLDVAHVSLQSGSGQGTADITLRCVYEPPTVQIVNPALGSPPVLVSERHQPVIQFVESHTPAGGALEPKITWSPKNTIDTKDYFSQLQDSIPFPIPVSVTATNVVGTASDNGQLVLMKVKDVDHFIVTVTPDTIPFNDYCFISGVALDENGNEAALDPETPITLTAEPNTTGRFYQDVVTYGQLKAGDVIYLGDQAEPIGVQDVIITVSGDGKSGTGKLVVKPKPCLVVKFSKPSVSTGGTDSVKILQKGFDGTLTPFPASQAFYVWMNKGESAGKLRSAGGDEGPNVMGLQPFVFIAADSLSADTVLVEIQAEVSSGGVEASIRNGATDELEKQQKLAYSKLLKILSGNKSGEIVAQPMGKSASKQKATASMQTHSGSALLKKLHPPRKLLAEGEGCVPTGTVMVVVEPSSLDHFDVRLDQDKDTVAFTEVTRVFVQAKNVEGKDIAFDENKTMQFLLEGELAYGTFIKPNSDTVKTYPVELSGVIYADAKSGKVQFGAVTLNPAVMAKPKITVVLESDTKKRGSKEIVVVEQTLKIVMVAPYEVQPIVPPTTVLNPRPENLKAFAVRLTRGGILKSGHSFRLTSDYVDGSGGHDHVPPANNRRTRSLENYGSFRSDQELGLGRRQEIEEQTRADRMSGFNFAASVFGDRMRLRLESTQNPLLWDTVSIAEKVPALVLLSDGVNYVKVGGRCNHHGPSDKGIPADCQTPDNDHYATAEVIVNISSIASEHQQLFGRSSVIAVNDMSLPQGGKFDVHGAWIGDHTYHRIGLDVDVRSSPMTGDLYEDVNRNGVYDPEVDGLILDKNGNGKYDAGSLSEFRLIATRNGAYLADLEDPGGENEHWHLYFWNVVR